MINRLIILNIFCNIIKEKIVIRGVDLVGREEGEDLIALSAAKLLVIVAHASC
jgi:hypothetical protein